MQTPDFLLHPASVGLVFKINSPGAVKQIFQRLGSVKLTPPKAGFWLNFSEERTLIRSWLNVDGRKLRKVRVPGGK